MKLYAVVGSPNARKTMAVINHLDDLDIEIEYLDFFAGDTQKPEFKNINPNAMVPTLVDGDFTLWESNAINQYLADKSENDELYPYDLTVRADINRWLFWEVSHFNNALGNISFESIAKKKFMGLDSNEAVISWAQDKLNRFAAILNDHMNGREYIVGHNVTLADYAMIHVEFFKDMIPFDWDPYPHVNQYFDRMRQNVHWHKTAPNSPEEIGRIPS
ncbi:glutathione S-transferase family protein [Pseudemcibacter aquimaris]|uniref:glutathione S-transferase family protein n=1 Tax=Pseudemcibacter aquimaris TaxID=2857064 RepID=UPI002011C6E3|nr:glutathione S-transferase family protein [Pseudemcibacter aquimaris]MCC3859620.1 glutathione S-transferase family protein [Pseudemcibacter aquimaris]WDU60015.1 glutathione S-transferase family protein [Pseudemcibacter aquimaris]